MKKELVVFKKEAGIWLESLEQEQAIFCVENITKILDFAKKNEDFFQGCGLYVVGSSLKTTQKFNDIDIVLVGLDFRAIVEYNKVFLIDPETLIEKGVLVEPRMFSILKGNENNPEIIKPITQCSPEEGGNHWEVLGRIGLEYNGRWYDYNIESCAHLGLTLLNYCNNNASPTYLISNLHKWFSPKNEEDYIISPFENYFYGQMDKFVVHSITIVSENEEIKFIDLSVHTENLYLGEWKKHQKALGLPFITLKEWPQKSKERKIITNLDYPDFIDPNGKNRATQYLGRMNSYFPDLTEIIEQNE